jgi:hypothetical protein
MAEIVKDVKFTTIVCVGCGIAFAVPSNYHDKLVQSKKIWYCPNGCSRSFTENNSVKKELDKTQKELQNLKDGRCPVCWQVRKNIILHIKQKHPDYLNKK